MQENNYREYEPSSTLKPFIKCYWSYSPDFSTEILINTNPVIPDGCVDIIFDLDLPTQSSCFVVGPMTKPMVNTKYNLFGVRFKPGRAVSFFHFPLQEMTDQIITINDMGQLRADNITDHLANHTCLNKRIFFMDTIFEKLLSDQPSLEKPIQYAINTIELSNGMINVQEITNKIGWSRQHLTRKFLKTTGLTPKFFSQVVRLNQTIQTHKGLKKCYSLADLAQIGGYFDQAHMTNEFKKMTGVTPQIFLKNA
jgi:AraC-like DNA-binding protein